MFVKRTNVSSGGRVLTYLQVMETYRDGKRVRQRLVKNLGREDQVDPREVDRLIASLAPYGTLPVGESSGLEGSELHSGRAFGHVHALNHLWEELGIGSILSGLASGRRFAFNVADVIKAIVFGRVLDPSSERALVQRWLSKIEAPEFQGIELHHAYRALPFLADIGPELEARLARVLINRLFVDASLVLFDTTSTYFEGLGPDGLANHGFSRDRRGDRPQVNLGLLTSREGWPLSHWLFEGRQADVVSMARASREFRARLDLGSFVVVADRGMVSERNLAYLQQEGIPYVIAERLRRKTAHEGLSRPGRFKRVTNHLEVKEVKRDGAERLLVCRNRERAEADRRTREAILARLEEQLEDGSWRESLKPGARRYLHVDGGTPRIDKKRLEEDAKLDGKWVLRTTTDLPAEQVALAYRGLWRVERAFRTLKTPLELRPIHHHSEPGVRGHVQACVLAYLLTRVMHDRLTAANLEIDVPDALGELARIERAPLQHAGLTVTKTTTPNAEQKAILDALKVPLPPKHQER